MKKFLQLSLMLITCFSLFGQADNALFQNVDPEITEQISLELSSDYSLLEINESLWSDLLTSHPSELSVVIPYQGEMLNLSLSKVNLVKNDFIVRTSSGNDLNYSQESNSVFYQGVVEGHENSHFALSILDNEIIGIGSIPGIGDVNLGKLKNDDQYIFFSESALNHGNPFACDVPDDYESEMLMEGIEPELADPEELVGDCVGVYFEIDEDIYLDKGGAIEAADYVIALFNEISLLYDADGIGVYISDIFVWEVVSPYDGISTTIDLLYTFGSTTVVWTGDIGHFVSYRGNGGVAWVDVICYGDQYYRKGVSDINSTFEEVPVYSWSVEVVSHEMGHNLGSPHTHACAWNGDDTAIDGCGPAAGYDEGCDAPLPVSGTVMSYCHLVGGVGIDLALGFGVQPSDLIQSRILAATCLGPCPEDIIIDAAVSNVEITSLTCEGDVIESELEITNNGTDDLVSLDIYVTVDGGLEETISWTGALGSGLSEIVAIGDLTLAVGTHTLEVAVANPNGEVDMDLDNDTLEIDFDITEYPLAEITSYSDVSCFGVEDGTIDASVSGGTPGYTYLWDNGAGTDQDAADIGANTYTLSVTDAAGCSVDVSQEITEPDELIVTPTVVTEPSCFGDLTGEVNVTVIGGVGGYTYSWSSGGDAATESGLGAGTYTIIVEDADGCSDEESITVDEPDELIATATVVGEPSCFSDLTGEGNVTVVGGVEPYSYAWSSGGDAATESGLGAGTYTVTVEDANGCTDEQSITISEPDELIATASVVAEPACFSDLTGEGNVTVIGGVEAYTYSWSSGGDAATEGGLGAGTYTVTVEDANGCTDEQSITITEPDEMIGDLFLLWEPECFGELTGIASIEVEGGVPDYEYEWSSGGTESTESDLGAGTYTITVIDANGCTIEDEITIVEPDEIILTATVEAEPVCFGDLTGVGNVDAIGGVPGYDYAWSSGGTGATESGLGAGTYTVIVSDTYGCSEEASITITQPDELIATASVVSEPVCFSDLTGEANVTVVGGVGAYTYSWSSGGDAATETGLGAGTYTITVEDANGCTNEQVVTITQPDNLIVTATVVSEPLCFSDLTGEGNATVTGGVEAYSYAWSSGGDAATESGLGAGTYTITVEDANGCVTEQSITITEPDELIATATVVSEPLCFSDLTGEGNVTVTGGVEAYNYSWSSGGDAATESGLGAGTYTITVEDANGCSTEQSITITEPDELIATATVVSEPLLCFSDLTGEGNVTVTGGVEAYSYSWSSGGDAATETGLGAGTFTVTVEDANGCTNEQEITITEPDEIVATATITIELFGSDGAIDVTVTGGTPEYTYSWSNGEETEDISGLEAGVYVLTVTDENGCTKEFEFVIDSELGIERIANNSFKLYPNPASSNVYIANNNQIEILSIQLYNSLGQLVFVDENATNTDYVMDVSEMAKGVYYIALNAQNQVQTIKLIIE